MSDKPKPDDVPLPDGFDPSVLGTCHIASYDEFLAVARAALSPADLDRFTVEERAELCYEQALLNNVVMHSTSTIEIYGGIVSSCWRDWLCGRFPRLRVIAEYLDPWVRGTQ